MNRMFRIAAQVCAVMCLAPTIAKAATPLSVYQGMVVPIARKYANQGVYYSAHYGQIAPDRIKLDAYDKDASRFVPAGDDDDEMTIPLPDEIQRPYGPSINLKNSFLLGGTIGYRTGNVRLEFELTYHNNNANKIRGLPSDSSEAADDGMGGMTYIAENTYSNIGRDNIGKLTSLFFMANLIYDYHFSSGIFPFIGVGIGGAYTELSAPFLKTQALLDAANMPVEDSMGNPIVTVERQVFDTNGFDIAVQAILGIGYVFTDHIEADLTYKYFETRLNDFGIDNFEASSVDPDYTPDRVRFEPKSYGGSYFALELRIH